MNQNQLTIFEEYESDNPDIHEINYTIDNCIRDRHKKYFHTFEYKCVYDIKLTNIGNNETVNLTTSDTIMCLYELEKTIKSARKNWFYLYSNI